MEMRTLKLRPSVRASALRLAVCALGFSVLAATALVATAPSASALSEIRREELPAPLSAPASPDGSSPATVPIPDPIHTSQPPSSEAEKPDGAQSPSQDGGDGEDKAGDAAGAPVPEIIYDLERLPEPVRRMHGLILEACKTGDIEKLRPLVGTADSGTQLSLTEIEGDPIEFLKGLSGDSEGQEILAIMEEVLSAGYVHMDAGAPQELYVWPYFFALPLDKLDPRQRVELFKIVTAGDYEDMQQFGAYIFYRLGITPEGRWAFFVAGD